MCKTSNMTNTHILKALNETLENIESGATLSRDFWEDFTEEVKQTSFDRRYTVRPLASNGFRSGIFTYQGRKYYYYRLNGHTDLERI